MHQAPLLYLFHLGMIIDAKALYDLLVKDEVQASHGTDKRTAIETLVCQDKLHACNSAVCWVSLELQYADSIRTPRCSL